MKRIILAAAVASLAAMPALAADKPPEGFKKAHDLVAQLPEFIPGLGVLYVKPETLPDGPFLAYDKEGKLVNTTYMIPMKDMEAHKNINDLASNSKAPVDHVDVSFNEGHPGLAEPHYHIVLWHVSRQQEAQLKE